MTNPMRVNADANTTQVCADAETAQPAIETHGDVTYQVTPAEDGLVSYKPIEGCTYCRRAGVPLRQADYVDKSACETCAEIVERAMAARVSQDMLTNANAAPKQEIPDAVEARAHDVGVSAINAFKAQWRAEMNAHENERKAIHDGAAEPAAWLADDPCDSWCVSNIDHSDSTHPSDRIHFGASFTVPMVTMEPIVMAYPERFAPPELTMSLDRRYREKEARVYLGIGDTPVSYATLDEAEKIAHTLLDLVAQARGKTGST